MPSQQLVTLEANVQKSGNAFVSLCKSNVTHTLSKQEVQYKNFLQGKKLKSSQGGDISAEMKFPAFYLLHQSPPPVLFL